MVVGAAALQVVFHVVLFILEEIVVFVIILGCYLIFACLVMENDVAQAG